MKDIDGNVYQTVKIGTQVWTVENFRTTKYNDGTPIPHVMNGIEWAGLGTPAYCWYENSQSKWGALYNWYAVNADRLAPEGWRVPTNEDWTKLGEYLTENGYNWDETTSGNKIAKAMAAQTDWTSTTLNGRIGNDLSKNNSSGFSALPGGYRYLNGGFVSVGYYGYWWSAEEFGASNAYSRYLYYGNEYLGRYPNDKRNGFSVRLIKDYKLELYKPLIGRKR